MRLRISVAATLLAAVFAGACSAPTSIGPAGQSGHGKSTAAASTTAPSPASGTFALKRASTTHRTGALTVTSPSGWRTVSYHGVVADIPTTWAVLPGTSFVCSFGAAPTAYLGPARTLYPCPTPVLGRPGNNGLWIDASYATAGASIIKSVVHGVTVEIGLSAYPSIARRIEASLHFDPASPHSGT